MLIASSLYGVKSEAVAVERARTKQELIGVDQKLVD